MLELLLYAIYAVSATMIVLAAKQLLFAYRRFTPRQQSLNPDDESLPSVSVCIPARNEGHVLTDCLEQVLKSTYPKLEILVLDDVSVDNTSALIKSFAHEGVRFVSGSPLPDGWLGKNHALQGLYKEASGTYLLFLDVDTRLAPNTIERIVRYAMTEKATMVSMMPRREDSWRASIVFSPLRYFWEIMFHRRKAPAAASNTWLIEREALVEKNGFELFKDAIQPESRLAAALIPNNRYRFLISTEWFGVSYEKKWRSQLATSVRLLYPQLGMSWLSTMAVVADLLLLLFPVWLLIVSVLQVWTIHGTISAVLVAAYTLLYAVYTKRVWRHGWWLGALLWPLIVIQEVCLIIASAIQYGRRRVTWKGRLVRSEVQS